MKKTTKVIILIIGVVLVLGILIATMNYFMKKSGDQAYFQAIAQEISEEQILVTPVEGSLELNSSDLIWVTKNVVSANKVPDIRVGDTIQIVYDGLIQETYPAQINNVFAIYLVEKGEVIPNEMDTSEAVAIEEESGTAEKEPELESESETESETEFESESQQEVKTLPLEEYGTITQNREEVHSLINGEIVYYCEMEQFFFNNSFEWADTVNVTLEKIYDEYAQAAMEHGKQWEDSTLDSSLLEGEKLNAQYCKVLYPTITYVGDDYVSIYYNDVQYFGGVHPYTYRMAYTIDMSNGDIVRPEEVLGKSTKEIFAENPILREWAQAESENNVYDEFYLTDDGVIFFRGQYPHFYEEVWVNR